MKNFYKTIYIDNNKFLYQLILSQGKGYITKELERIFICLIYNVSINKKFSKNFEMFEFIDDYRNDAFIRCYEIFMCYKTDYNNPVAYFTEIIKRSFANSYHVLRGDYIKNRQKSGVIAFKSLSISNIQNLF